MGFRYRRLVYRTGTGGRTRGVVLLHAWVDFYGLRDNRYVTLMGSTILLVVPPGLEEMGDRLTKQMEGQYAFQRAKTTPIQ